MNYYYKVFCIETILIQVFLLVFTFSLCFFFVLTLFALFALFTLFIFYFRLQNNFLNLLQRYLTVNYTLCFYFKSKLHLSCVNIVKFDTTDKSLEVQYFTIQIGLYRPNIFISAFLAINRKSANLSSSNQIM